MIAVKNDRGRVASLRELDLLDSPKGTIFDRFTKLCVDLFDCPIALISLVDADRQWFLSSIGVDVSETPREISFCNHAIAGECTLLVPDASKDERFLTNPLVTSAPHIQSYMGEPIRSPDGAFIGTLCVADNRPGRFSECDIAKLQRLARLTEEQIKYRSEAVRTLALNDRLEQQTKALKRSNHIFEQAEKIAKVGSWQIDLLNDNLTWSKEVYNIHGLAHETPITVKDAIRYYVGEERSDLVRAMSHSITTGKAFCVDADFISDDKQMKRVRVMGELLNRGTPESERLVGVIQDISEAYNSQLALRRAADHDSLTGLLNRSAFDRMLLNRLQSRKRDDSEVFVLLFDLDGFKDVNDTFGHLVGDVVLEEVSARLLNEIPADAAAARWGGDEFVVIAPSGVSKEGVVALSERILGAVERKFAICDSKLNISATCGIAVSEHSITGNELLRRADLALYHGKDREPGRCHYYLPEMEAKNYQRLKAIAEVRSALDQNRLYAAYQPIVELSTNRLIGLEALMRLQSPNGQEVTATQVLPALFDPITSRDIGREMTRFIGEDVGGLLVAQPDLQFVSLNATEADLLTRQFASKALHALQHYDVAPQNIVVEVTETMLMVNDRQTVRSVLHELSAAGIQIALDDFGTGFSSLSHLRDFPIDKVKIDGSFVRNICSNHQDRMIVQALIAMAKNMNIDIIAEGIETENQRTLLMQMGCTYGQGYLIKPPETACRIKLLNLSSSNRHLIHRTANG